MYIGVSWLLVAKEGLLKMEVVAQRFEREDGILERVSKDPCIKDGTYISEEGLEELMLDYETMMISYKPCKDLMMERMESQLLQHCSNF
jgi:hypothetical protein